MSGKVFLHVDLDAFFASVEVLDHPEYKGKPLIVGGLPTDARSVVSTASYEARKYGVHSAMPIFKAYQLCPKGIFIRGNYERYSEKSMEVMNIFKDFSPDVAQVSIDEAFIDITGTEKLFGAPVEVAKKIKERVKNECGLTVSVGIASTKYVAKICSGYRKPDGLTIVPEGLEEEFMLSLPLEKLWGAGEKTLGALKNSGIYTMEQLHSKSENLLQSIFTKNTGSFLYDAVRGGKNIQLGQEAENHSISNETTFAHDLTDINAIETALLELCHTVMFRLRKNKMHSQTVCVKIKYNDFTTVSIQETSNRIVTSVDDFFTRTKILFNKKWDKSKPIRLLGVGVHNVETNEIPVQKDLFDFGEEKKANSEKAIVKLEEKFAGLKIKKARNLSTLLILGFINLILFSNQKIFAKENSVENSTAKSPIIFSLSDELIAPTEESEPYLFANETNDFEFETFGFWQGELTSTSSIGINKKTSYAPFSLNFGTPIFSQKVDLTANLKIKNNFFFNLNFADNFETNTIVTGYQNNKTFINQIKIGNRGIEFPQDYSSALTETSIFGGNNESPGLIITGSKDNFYLDSVFRIEGLAQQSKTFYGMNEATINYFQIQNYEKYTNYEFPSKEIVSSILKIYRQDNDIWTELNSTDYEINLQDLSLTFLRNNSGFNKLAIMFNSTADILTLQNQVQNYLDELKILFKNSNIDITKHLKEYWIQIQGSNCLVIQENNFFSPFQNCSIYNTTFFADSSQKDQCLVLNKNTQKESEDFRLERFVTSKDILKFSLVNNNSTISTAAGNFPLAQINPEIYFGLTPTENQNQLQIVYKHYTKVNSLFIGNNAETSSVKVQINGITDIGAKYDNQTGTVKTSKTIGDYDKVQITWNETDFTKDIFLKSELGVKYKINKDLTFDTSVSSSLPISKNSTTTGNINFNSGLNYSTKNLEFKTGFSGTTNGLGSNAKMILFELDQNKEVTTYLTNQCAYTIDQTTIQRNSNPYIKPILSTTLDQSITGYKSILYADFSGTITEENKTAWTGQKIYLGNQGYNLPNTNQFNIAIKNEVQNTTDIKIFLQLGNPLLTEEFFEVTNQIDFSKTDWQIVNINLSEQTRSLISNYPYVHLIITKETSSIKTSTNEQNIVKISCGPWSHEGTNLILSCDQNIRCTSSQSYRIIDNSTNQNIENINWKYLQTPDEFTNTKLIITKFFQEANICDYEELVMDFKISTSEKFSTPILNSQEQFELILKNQDEVCLKVLFNFNELEEQIFNSNDFCRLTINTKDLTATINNKTISASITYNSSIKPTKMELLFDTISNSGLILKSGTLSISNLWLTKNKKQLKAKNYTSVTADYDNLYLNMQGQIQGIVFEDKSTQNQSSIDASFIHSFWNLKVDSLIKAQYSSLEQEESFFETNNLNGITNYKLNLKTEKPILNFLSFQTINEENKSSKSAVSSEDFSMNFSSIKIPLEISGKTYGAFDNFSAEQELSATIKSKTKWNSFIVNAKGYGTKEISSTSSNLFFDAKKLSYNFTENFTKYRTTNFSIEESFKIPKSTLNPKLQIISQTSKSTYFNDSTKTILLLPFKINSTNLSFEYNKKINSQQNTQDLNLQNYFSDATYLLSSNTVFYWQQLPLQDIFSNNLSYQIQNCNNSTYESNYIFKISKQMSNTTKDFFIPQSAGLSFGRKISKENQIKDVYKLTMNATNQSLNLFGTTGVKPIFNWYKKDSYFSNANINLLFPTSSNPTIEFSWFAENQLYFTDKNNLRNSVIIDFEDLQNNCISLTSQYFYKGNNSLISDAITGITKKEFNQKSIMRSENFCYKFMTSNQSTTYNQNTTIQSLEYFHKNQTQLNKNLSLWISAGFLIYDSKNISSRIDLNGSIGGKVSF